MTWERKLFKPEVNEMLDKGMDPFLVYVIMKEKKEIEDNKELIGILQDFSQIKVGESILDKAIECGLLRFIQSRERKAFIKAASLPVFSDFPPEQEWNDYLKSEAYHD